MNPNRYLKTPKVFGFHGVYKTVVNHAKVLDNRLMLNESGNQLLKIREQDKGSWAFLMEKKRLGYDGIFSKLAPRRRIKDVDDDQV
jgi:hypothetical protein